MDWSNDGRGKGRKLQLLRPCVYLGDRLCEHGQVRTTTLSTRRGLRGGNRNSQAVQLLDGSLG